MRSPRYLKVSLRGCRSWFLTLATTGLLLVAGRADEPAVPTGRLTGTFDGIHVEYSPGQEELARLLAGRFAARNREAVAARKQQPPAVAAAEVPLSPAEMRVNRVRYLAAICAQLALAKPTAIQEECYDAFLDSYEQHMRSLEMIYQLMAEAGDRWDRVALWDRAELVGRLEKGEVLPGFSYDPVTKKGNSSFRLPEVNLHDDRLVEIYARREQLKNDYEFRITAGEGGTVNYQGGVTVGKKKSRPKEETPAPSAVDPTPMAVPLVIPADLAALPASEVAAKLWDSKITGFFGDLTRAGLKPHPTIDPTIVFLVLHETTEIGILDYYYRGKDRRWFCDGVANYVAWRVVRDLHGAEAASKVYDLPDQLARYADLREQADLRKWPATENQVHEEQESRLNRARYAYATQAVFLMNARAGENALPQLFAEIGHTKPGKVSMKTVEQAWKKTAGTKLDTVLAEAVAAPAMPPSAGQ